jgi:CRP-like cAMP-binding protein
VNNPGVFAVHTAGSAAVDASRITAFPIFADVPATELEALAAAMAETEIAAGTTILTDGDNGYIIYFIEEGEADVFGDKGEAIASLGPGETFGEIALLVTGRRMATVVARTPMRVLSLFDQDLNRVLRRVPELERTLRRLGGERLSS